MGRAYGDTIAAIVAVVDDVPRRACDIARAAGVPKSYISEALCRARKHGIVVQVGEKPRRRWVAGDIVGLLGGGLT